MFNEGQREFISEVETTAKKISKAVSKKAPYIAFTLSTLFSHPSAVYSEILSNSDLIFPTPIISELKPPFYNSQEQVSSEMVYAQKQAWRSSNWWPIFEETAKRDGLPRLFDQWWSLDMIDVLNGHETTTGPFYRWGQEIAANVQRDYENDDIQKASAGWCLIEAAITLLEPEPTWAPKQVGPYSLGRDLIEGKMIAKHAGDYFINVDASSQTLAQLLQQGVPIVVDLPERPGRWYRAVNGVDVARNVVLLTNYGFPDKELDAGRIVGAWAVFHNLPPEYLAQLDPKIKAEAEARAVPGLTDEMVDPFIYP